MKVMDSENMRIQHSTCEAMSKYSFSSPSNFVLQKEREITHILDAHRLWREFTPPRPLQSVTPYDLLATHLLNCFHALLNYVRDSQMACLGVQPPAFAPTFVNLFYIQNLQSS
jgi:hypothetical protein